MGKDTGIQWTDHSFNCWRGCTKVSEGCKNCYAETQSRRNPAVLGMWGPKGTRVVASESMWSQPLKWQREAKEVGVRRRVFCASFADVFEEWTGPMVASDGRQMRKLQDGSWVWNGGIMRNDLPLTMQDVRRRLFDLIDRTPDLDYLLLTKRPQNILPMIHDAWCTRVPGHVSQNPGDGRRWEIPSNVFLGTSVENQATADERIPHLLAIPAKVRFLSMEPLLGPVSLSRWTNRTIPRYGFSRHQDLALDLCRREYGTCPFGCVKDGGPNCNANVRAIPPVADRQCEPGRLTQGQDYPAGIDWVIVGGESGSKARPFDLQWARDLRDQCGAAGVAFFMKQLGFRPTTTDGNWGGGKLPTINPDRRNEWVLQDPHGGDPGEWPADLRVREFPAVEREGVRQ